MTPPKLTHVCVHTEGLHYNNIHLARCVEALCSEKKLPLSMFYATNSEELKLLKCIANDDFRHCLFYFIFNSRSLNSTQGEIRVGPSHQVHRVTA